MSQHEKRTRAAGWSALCVISFIVAAAAANATYPVVSPVTVPLYAASHVPGSAPQEGDANPIEARLRRIEDKLDKILAIAEAANAEQPSTQPGDSTVSPAASLKSAAVKCAKCHHANVAEEKGGGFQLFTPAGAFVQLQARDIKRLTEKVTTGVMPPPPATLTEQEKSALLDAFKSRPK